jgi:predicted branched-subunit amino acid permease
MGLSVASALDGSAWRRVLLAQLVVDESWAVAHRSDGTLDRDRLIGAAALLYVVHVSATAIGAFGAGGVADPAALGLDAAFPAMFLVLLRPHLAQPRARWVAGLGAALALALTPVVPPGVAIVAAAGAVMVGLRRP